MKLAIIRHGQTNANAQRLIQGRIDNPLNKVGQKQAKDAGQMIKKEGLSFDVIAASPLSRAFETAQLVARKLNYKNDIYVAPLFVERDFKPYEMQPIDDVFPIILNTGYEHPEYEDDEMLENRVHEGLIQLAHKFKGKKVLLAAHAHVIRAALILSNPDKFNYDNYPLNNGSIHLFHIDGDKVIFEGSINND